jgi:hypothetical protein
MIRKSGAVSIALLFENAFPWGIPETTYILYIGRLIG